MLVRDLHVRIINAATGELLRQLTLDRGRNYQLAGPTPGTPRKGRTPNPDVGSGSFLSRSRSQTVGPVGFEPTLSRT
jgi:hypothetical protein